MTSLSTLFEPNYTILTFLMIKTFFYVEAIGALGVIRAFSAKRASRILAGFAGLAALIGLACKYIPAVAGLTGTEAGRLADTVLKAGALTPGDGMALPIGITVLFGLSAIVPGRRWWGLDAVFALCAAGFFGLWIYTLL